VEAGVPRSFKGKLQEFIEKEAKSDGDVLPVDAELSDWMSALRRPGPAEKRRYSRSWILYS
jgi:hypothetical protein